MDLREIFFRRVDKLIYRLRIEANSSCLAIDTLRALSSDYIGNNLDTNIGPNLKWVPLNGDETKLIKGMALANAAKQIAPNPEIVSLADSALVAYFALKDEELGSQCKKIVESISNRKKLNVQLTSSPMEFTQGYLEKLASGTLGGIPNPAQVIEACGTRITELLRTFETEPTLEADTDPGAITQILSRAIELGLSVDFRIDRPQASSVDDVWSYVAERASLVSSQEALSMFDQCYVLAALCDSPVKVGRTFRRHGITTEQVMKFIKEYKTRQDC